jgi:ADP-ribose pyrophosphatase
MSEDESPETGRNSDGRQLEDHPRFDDGRRHDIPDDPEWSVIDARIEHETPWYVGGYDLVEQPDGSRKRYYWVELAAATVVIAIADGQVLFVEQYRPTIRETQMELPAGVVEAGESFTGAAERELREETGFDPSATSLLQEVWCTTGLLRHKRGYVFAEGLDPVGQSLDENEYLTPRSIPVEEALTTARETPTNDATVAALLVATEEGLLQ